MFILYVVVVIRVSSISLSVFLYYRDYREGSVCAQNSGGSLQGSMLFKLCANHWRTGLNIMYN